MSFVSYEYLLLLLPLTLITYFLLNKYEKYNISKIILIVASLAFYAFGGWLCLALLIASILVNYFIANRTAVAKDEVRGKTLFVTGLVFNIALLFVFKYYNFFSNAINDLGCSLPSLNLILPLGISFYTFKQISFLVDAKNSGGGYHQYNLVDYLLYVTFFPTILQGPITYFSETVPQFNDLSKKKYNADNFAAGLWVFTIGLFKKAIVADLLGLAVNYGYANLSTISTFDTWLLMLSYTLQIYFDFSGYTDMAAGAAKMLNIDLPINFNSPYRAISIVDFWKRWHMTLTRFFTKYVYIPLGGNRRGRIRTYLNIMIVFLISGLWHGAEWSFVLWGALHGIAQILTKLIDEKTGFFSKRKSKSITVLNWAFTFLLVNLLWVLFRADSISQAFSVYGKLFSFTGGSITSLITTIKGSALISALRETELYYLIGLIPVIGAYLAKYLLYVLMLISGILILLPKNTNNSLTCFKPTWIKLVVAICICFWCIISITGETSFVYWNF